MGFINWIRSLGTTEQQRENIYKMFGSFAANSLALNNGSLISQSYGSNVDVYSIIRKIVDVSKAQEWIVERRFNNGTWKEVQNSTLFDLMANPNPVKGYNWGDVHELILLYLLTTGNAYIKCGTTIQGDIYQDIDILPSDSVTIESNQDFFIPKYKYLFTYGRTHREFTMEEISHIKFHNPCFNSFNEDLYGLSPIQVAAMVVKTGNDRWEADAALLQNRGAIGMITDKSNIPMTPEQAKEAQNTWNNETGGTHNFGKIKVTNKDLGFIQMAMSPSDLQLIEKGVVNTRALCNVYGLDSSLFNDPENKTYNNRLEAEKAMYTNCIIPLSKKVCDGLSFIIKNHYPVGEYRLRQDFSGVEALQEDKLRKAQILTMTKQNGILTANEVRRELDYETLPEENADILMIGGVPIANTLEEQKNIPAVN
jgi:HK97 family phage portal protein